MRSQTVIIRGVSVPKGGERCNQMMWSSYNHCLRSHLLESVNKINNCLIRTSNHYTKHKVTSHTHTPTPPLPPPPLPQTQPYPHKKHTMILLSFKCICAYFRQNRWQCKFTWRWIPNNMQTTLVFGIVMTSIQQEYSPERLIKHFISGVDSVFMYKKC